VCREDRKEVLADRSCLSKSYFFGIELYVQMVPFAGFRSTGRSKWKRGERNLKKAAVDSSS
jgi:hypothetical protein